MLSTMVLPQYPLSLAQRWPQKCWLYQTESTGPKSCTVPELPLRILSLLPDPLPASRKEIQHGHHTPKYSPYYQGKKQVTSTGSVEEGIEWGLEAQSPEFSCLGCVTLDMALPLHAEPQFPHL